MLHKHHIFGLFSHPTEEWGTIKEEKYSITELCFTRLSLSLAIPAVCFFIGITQVGWSFSGSEFNQIPIASALPQAIAFFFAIILGTVFMAYCTYYMERTFGADASFARCLLFITYTATPMYLAGLVGLMPIIWLVMLALMAGVSYSLYLLFIGIPIFMNIPEGKGFMFSTSIIAAGLCTLSVFIVTTLVIWSKGL